MLKEERQQLILDKIGADKKVTLVALSKELDVSYDSIRRDIIELEERGLLRKVHGGAITNSYLPMKVRQRMGIPNPEIVRIARKTLRLIQPGQTILMDGGTTPLYIVEQFPKEMELTVVTNNLPLAVVLADHPHIEVMVLGGSFYKRYQITMGQTVMDQLAHLRVDWYLMGVVGSHPDEGFSLRNHEETLLKRRMMQTARQVAVCLTTEKLHTPAAHRICGLEDVSLLITSLNPSDAQLAEYQEKGLEIW
ncbi:MAG: DeoR/GlpR family DNA-binding transcription regulator [Cytophagaceae bacterium]|nr:DeoR/GlpR family DNA-binding transcription regulator [Cytophagaceae bacterium]